jgi:hypothetical protein
MTRTVSPHELARAACLARQSGLIPPRGGACTCGPLRRHAVEIAARLHRIDPEHTPDAADLDEQSSALVLLVMLGPEHAATVLENLTGPAASADTPLTASAVGRVEVP